MITYSTRMFGKQATCPSAETLVSYGTASLSKELTAGVRRHLSACEFCGAELQLLTRHRPPANERYVYTKMPAALRYLAESLMAGSLLRLETLTEAICEKERLTLTQ